MGKRKDENGSYWQNMRAYEKGLLEWAFETTGDSPTRTAEMLGINASYLYERCKIVGIHRPGKGKKIDEAGVVVAATPKLKLVPAAKATEPELDEAEAEAEVEDVEDEEGDAEAEDSAEETDSDAIGDSVDAEDAEDADVDEEADDEDGVDEDDYIEEEVPDDECLCGAKLLTVEEREKWVECETCHTNRLTNATGAVPAVMLDDDEEVG